MYKPKKKYALSQILNMPIVQEVEDTPKKKSKSQVSLHKILHGEGSSNMRIIRTLGKMWDLIEGNE